MKLPRFFSRSRSSRRGFSLVELTLVSAMSAAVIGAAVLAYQAISARQKRFSEYGVVTMATTDLANLYGIADGSTTLSAWFAPNYGRAIRADDLRELFYSDVETASAVYCLPRAGRSTGRPTSISIPDGTFGPGLDTPAAFLSHLATVDSTTASAFTTYVGAPPASSRNASIFIIQPSLNDSPNVLAVRAIWEIDFIAATSSSNNAGIHASVRRYVGNTLSHYYDVVYAKRADQTSSEFAANLPSFGPPFIHFERSVRRSASLTSDDNYRRAGAEPFYFIWWPDPAAPTLANPEASSPVDAAGNAIGSSDWRRSYTQHYGQTSYFFVIPQFPCVR